MYEFYERDWTYMIEKYIKNEYKVKSFARSRCNWMENIKDICKEFYCIYVDKVQLHTDAYIIFGWLKGNHPEKLLTLVAWPL
jgi:hypothetical protein